MNRRTSILIVLALAVEVGALGCTRASVSGAPSESDLKELTVDEVDARIASKDGKTFVYDNNPKERYAKGHVPTAKWVAFNHVTAADLPTDKGATLIFYCASVF